jgi:putative Holliday junction resolvase
MALDVGTKTIGVAVTDEMGWSAQGLDTIRRADLNKDIAAITSFIAEYKVETLVVGLPLRAEGEIGIQAKKVLKFINNIKKSLLTRFPDLKIETWDESMTTAEAHEVLAGAKVTSKKRKKVVDKLAAVFILESYMRGKEFG